MTAQPNCSECGNPIKAGQDLCDKCSPVDDELTVAPSANTDAIDENTIDATETHGIEDYSSPQSGQNFGDYELVEEIARGGMGVVYKALHKKLNRIVALKMIIGGRFSSSEDRERFKVEAEAAAKLDHSGIVPVYEFGEIDGHTFFAMKYVEGGTLAQRISNFKNDLDSGVKLLCKVARAVHHAHQRAILHRDLKPANILIDSSGQPLVTDLGLAKSTSTDSNLTETGAILGTPKYMAPEQAAGNQSVTTAADIFSLGAILYEMLTGRTPHSGSTPVETLMSAINEEPKAPAKWNSKVDRELELICTKAIQTDPNNRYSSAAAFADDLQSWLNGESISVRAPSVGAQLKRWLNHNKRLSYVVFAVMIGLAFAVPILANIFGGSSSDLGDVYEFFPGADKPWIYRIISMPNWTDDVFAALLLLGIWPLLGFVNALVTRPKSLMGSINIGALTATCCVAIASILLGWVILVAQTAEYSAKRTKLLADVVWTPSEKSESEIRNTLNEVYPGIENVDKDKRSEVFTNRVVAEQFALGPKALGQIAMTGICIAIPIIYGTVLGFLLLSRNTWIWVAAIRYYISWIAVTFSGFSILVLIGFVGQNSNKGMTTTVAITFVVASVVLFLTIRKWRKEPVLAN